MELAKFGAGGDAKLVGNGVPGLAVDIERLGVLLGSRSVECLHQHSHDRSLSGLSASRRRSSGTASFHVAAQRQFGRDAKLDGAEA